VKFIYFVAQAISFDIEQDLEYHDINVIHIFKTISSKKLREPSICKNVSRKNIAIFCILYIMMQLNHLFPIL